MGIENILTLTRTEVREFDLLAIEHLGIPGIVLMENAGRHVAEAVIHLMKQELHLSLGDARVAVLCGGGNNGGDGYVAARHLYNAGVHVKLFASKDPTTLKGDAAINAHVTAKMGVPTVDARQFVGTIDALRPWHFLIDALLGTGFRGEVRDDVAQLITACNRASAGGARVIAVDLPSGLDCDTGQPARPTVQADLTVTFVAPKPGLASERARAHVGRIMTVDIGAPLDLVRLLHT